MLFFRPRHWLTGPVFMMLSIIFTMIFFLQSVSYYRSTQKYYRLQGYKAMVDELSYKMTDVDRVATKSSLLLTRISQILHKKKPESRSVLYGR